MTHLVLLLLKPTKIQIKCEVGERRDLCASVSRWNPRYIDREDFPKRRHTKAGDS